MLTGTVFVMLTAIFFLEMMIDILFVELTQIASYNVKLDFFLMLTDLGACNVDDSVLCNILSFVCEMLTEIVACYVC